MYEKKFLLALILTITVEFFVILFLRKFFVKKLRRVRIKDILLFCFFASSLTLPYLWFILPIFILNRFIYIFISEIFVIAVEAIFYEKVFKINLNQAIKISFLSNFFSFLTSFFIF